MDFCPEVQIVAAVESVTTHTQTAGNQPVKVQGNLSPDITARFYDETSSRIIEKLIECGTETRGPRLEKDY